MWVRLRSGKLVEVPHAQDTVPPRPDRLHRHDDPPSSARAARALITSGAWSTQAAQVLKGLEMFNGSTSRELAELCGFDRHMVARRLPDLLADGLVMRMRATDDGGDCRWYTRQRPVETIESPLLCGEEG